MSQSARCCPASADRARIDLRSGRTIAHSLRTNPWANPKLVVQEACAIAASLGLPVSLPMPGPLQQLPGTLFGVLARSGLAPDQLELAITEPIVAFCGVEGLLALSALRDVGIGLVLAGFSASAVPLLRWLPVQGVVLPPEATSAALGLGAHAAELQSLIAAARAHDLTVTATGIDTECRRAVLSGLGCDQGEGELFD